MFLAKADILTPHALHIVALEQRMRALPVNILIAKV